MKTLAQLNIASKCTRLLEDLLKHFLNKTDTEIIRNSKLASAGKNLQYLSALKKTSTSSEMSPYC